MDQDKLIAKIAELEGKLKELERDLIHDSLTGLKTRAFFEDEMETFLDAIANVEAGKRKEWFGFKNISVLFLDIDFFKKINDTYGHEVGDKVLQSVAKTIGGSLRDGDTAARWGGEEIVVSLLGAGEVDAVKKAEEIREEISKLTFHDTPDVSVTISIGVANANPGMKCKELIKCADEAMYKAKETGRNKVVAFSTL